MTKIGREKLLEKEDPIFQSDEGKVLLEGDFFDEIFVEGSDKRYYALSAKAEKTLKSKNITNKIKEDVATAIIPDRMIVESEKWNNIYFKRVEFLKRFYTGCRADREYILFTLDDAKEMVFACELANTEDVTYVFAGVFDEKIDDHISQLIGLSNSGMIDNIEIIVDSLEMARILEEEGITSAKTPHISIVQM